ncbi:MAG TPA: cupin domain-containing protein [Chitinophagaceae bacterium]|nr:cupin domain-containing protein [Chitinophagaceae bacterium]
MKQIMKPAIMAMAISFVFIACNNEEKTDSSGKDSAQNKTTTTETQTQTQNLDAAKVAADRYSVVKDTMGIRVLSLNYKPGDSSAMHSHPDLVLYVVDGGKTEFTMKDGSKTTMDLPSGTAAIVGSTTHSVKNVGTTTVNGYLFEINRPNKAASTDNTMDAVKVDPKHYKLIQDSLNIRIVMADYKPGTSSPMHSHPDNVLYVISASKAEFTKKDGSKQVMQLDKGMIAIGPADTHSVKNVGNTNAKVLLVEVNRPQN